MTKTKNLATTELNNLIIASIALGYTYDKNVFDLSDYYSVVVVWQRNIFGVTKRAKNSKKLLQGSTVQTVFYIHISHNSGNTKGRKCREKVFKMLISAFQHN